MGKPKAPPPPDYAAAAKAQGEANVNSSLATNYMNQVNQTGPYGSITYNRSNTDGYTLPDGTFIPNTTVTTTLSPEQQKLYDQNVNISTQLNDLATQGIGYVSEASSKPLDLASLPPMTTSLNPAEYKNAAEKGTLGLQTLGAAPTYSNIGSGPEYNKAASAPQTQAMGNGPAYQQMSNGPAYQQMGNGPNYDRLNSVGNIQTGVQGTNYQDQYDFSNVSQMPKYEDFNSSRDKITDAMMQRLQPYIDRDREALRTQLVNQGVGQGTEAYGWDMDTFQRGVNDQRIAALLAGSQEQQNLFNNAMGLRQQGVQEAFAQGNLKNSVADALFNQRLQQGAFANSAQAQQFGQQSAITGYNNDQAAREMAAQREALGYNNTLADKTYGNQNQALAYNNEQAYKQAAFNQGTTAYNNDLAYKQAAFNQDANAYNNNLASQQFKDQQATAEFNNSNAAKSFADNLASVGVNNQAQQQEYAQNQQDLLNYNQAREAQFSQGLASGQFANQAHAQALQEADYAKNAPLNMLLALKSGNQVQIPQFMNAATGTQIQPAPIYNATADGYNAQMQKYQADLQARGGFLSGLASLGSAIITSDRRLKTNINLIGQRPDGLNLYSYDYVWGQPAVGVMADEVAVLRPEALGPVVGGYATVNYGAL